MCDDLSRCTLYFPLYADGGGTQAKLAVSWVYTRWDCMNDASAERTENVPVAPMGDWSFVWNVSPRRFGEKLSISTLEPVPSNRLKYPLRV